MYLKSIEVQGFKSFANKIVFEFHNGITGIVGPNGSGKSNVADAVRWVLGEQRVKQLRGGNMQDVIFSGTELRKPLSYASVAITLDNSDHHLPIDYEEVTIARKLYRSGESEYLMNGSACRLKDINELFYDTGIGKEGYSIIGQGQIDKILSGKPEERRELFDEAAGIVKFKRRKNMSVKKLEEERQNLVRVNDILAELEKQIGPLERQSEVAKEYLKKKESLKTYDINMFLLESARLKDEIRALDELIANTQKELDESNREYESTKAEYETVEEQTDALDAELERAKRQKNETTLLKQQLEGQIELLKEQINTARMNDEHLEQRTKAIRADLEEREGQLAKIRDEKEEIDAALSKIAETRQESQERLNDIQTQLAELTKSVEDGRNDMIALLNHRSQTKANIQKYDTLLEQIQVQKAQVNQKLITVQSEVSRQELLLAEHEKELRDVSDTILTYEEKRKDQETLIDSLKKKIAELTENLEKTQALYHRESSRLESLRNMTERYDGYGNSIRKVMERKNQEKGLHGVVADIIKVDRQYETAIETALGGSIQNIVTDDEATAKRMIQYLKQNKFGRATFLPLTAVGHGNGFKQQEALKEKGVIGLAHTLVQVEDQYLGLAENLLGRTVVVKHIDDGIALARKYRQSIRIVTLEGELMNVGGAMSGGAFKNSSSLLSRRREIEEGEKKVGTLKAQIADEQRRIEETKSARSSAYAEVEQIKDRLQEAYVAQNAAKIKADQTRLRKEEAENSSLSMKEESSSLEKQIADIRGSHETIERELTSSREQEETINRLIEESQQKIEEIRLLEVTQMQETEKINLDYAAFEQKILFVQENEDRITDEMQRFEEELENLSTSKGDAFDEIRKKEKDIEDIRLTIEDSKELFAEIEKEIARFTMEKEELTKQHKIFLARREELSKHMSELDKEVFRLTSRHESYEEAIEKQINYMWEEYELTYNMAMEIRDENLNDLSYMKKEIHQLKNEIKALGNVNVNAIEDYKEVSERYGFLKTQHDDLVEAEATLVQIIEELDEAMRKQFREQFSRISEEFNQVFKQLFGGGKGTLELMEDEDILEAGIRIIAQPPGKKLQNMMQLSGGEKALTAISLLFAIQNLKPSPFCLLDEIEAALDDSNVDRFAKYLHKLTRHTQFIVITHRRGTMTAADRLYGITMQEKGVSTLVSVDLLEKDLDD